MAALIRRPNSLGTPSEEVEGPLLLESCGLKKVYMARPVSTGRFAWPVHRVTDEFRSEVLIRWCDGLHMLKSE